MISGPKYKICRRLGSNVFEKCQTQKFSVSEGKKAKTGKGTKKKALSTFGQQLLEKQKIRFSYGVSEKQFGNYVKKAVTQKGKPAGKALFDLLEARLDNVVYRLGLAKTRRLARQMVAHGHITVNGRKVTIPSYSVTKDEVVSIREGSKSSVLFSDLPKKLKDHTSPSWLSMNAEKGEAKIVGTPGDTDSVFNWSAVLEYYSR